MQDDKTIEYYRIISESTLVVAPVPKSMITVKIAPDFGEQFSIDICPKAQIDELKRKINEESSNAIPRNRQILLYHGTQLSDDRTLNHFNITDGDTIVYYEWGENHTIMFKKFDGTVDSVNFDPTATLSSVLQMIGDVVGCSATQLRLYYDDKVVDDAFLLYWWRKCKTYELARVAGGGGCGVVLVRKDSDRYIPIDASKSDTIESLKKKFESREKISFSSQILCFNGKELNDNGATLESCGINPETTPVLVLKQEQRLHLFIRNLTGEFFDLTIPQEDIVLDLMWRILKHEDMFDSLASSELRLIFAGRQLLEDQLLSAYGIPDNSTIHTVLRLRG